MWLINMSWSWALVIFCRSRVTGKKSAKFVVSQNQCFGETSKVHTSNKDSLTPEGFSRYWPRSFGKVQGQWNEKCKIYVQSITKNFLWRIIENPHLAKKSLLSLRLCHFVEYALKQLKSADRIQTKDLMKLTSIWRKTISLHGFETSCLHPHSLERKIPVSFVKPVNQFFFESSCVIVTFKGTCYCLQELRSFDYT